MLLYCVTYWPFWPFLGEKQGAIAARIWFKIRDTKLLLDVILIKYTRIYYYFHESPEIKKGYNST